jgi:hypothetical protein
LIIDLLERSIILTLYLHHNFIMAASAKTTHKLLFLTPVHDAKSDTYTSIWTLHMADGSYATGASYHGTAKPGPSTNWSTVKNETLQHYELKEDEKPEDIHNFYIRMCGKGELVKAPQEDEKAQIKHKPTRRGCRAGRKIQQKRLDLANYLLDYCTDETWDHLLSEGKGELSKKTQRVICKASQLLERAQASASHERGLLIDA